MFVAMYHSQQFNHNALKVFKNLATEERRRSVHKSNSPLVLRAATSAKLLVLSGFYSFLSRQIKHEVNNNGACRLLQSVDMNENIFCEMNEL